MNNTIGFEEFHQTGAAGDHVDPDRIFGPGGVAALDGFDDRPVKGTAHLVAVEFDEQSDVGLHRFANRSDVRQQPRPT